MNKRLNNLEPIGTYNTKSLLAPVPILKSRGFPTITDTRCCEKDFGTNYEDLSVDNMPVNNFSLPQYSDLNKCMVLSENDMKKINQEMEKNNFNPEDIFSKNRKNLFSKRNVDLGKNVISYKIVSKKDKK